MLMLSFLPLVALSYVILRPPAPAPCQQKPDRWTAARRDDPKASRAVEAAGRRAEKRRFGGRVVRSSGRRDGEDHHVSAPSHRRGWASARRCQTRNRPRWRSRWTRLATTAGALRSWPGTQQQMRPQWWLRRGRFAAAASPGRRAAAAAAVRNASVVRDAEGGEAAVAAAADYERVARDWALAAAAAAAVHCRTGREFRLCSNAYNAAVSR